MNDFIFSLQGGKLMNEYLYTISELNEKSIEELDTMLTEHGYDTDDFVDKDFRVEVLSNLMKG